MERLCQDLEDTALMESEQYQDVEAEILISHPNLNLTRLSQVSRLNLKTSWGLHSFLNMALTFILLCSIIAVWLYEDIKSVNCSVCIDHYHHYSPALDATEPGSRVTQLNHTKWSPYNPGSGASLDSVNDKWTEILRVGIFSISEEELRLLGGSKDSVRLPPESGGGYMRYLSSHHLLHCLYLLHQSLHQDFYQNISSFWTLTQARRQSHWYHCIETLRQTVICDADTTVVTHRWIEKLDMPIAVQENPRRCSNWDAHFSWQLDRQVPAPSQPISKPIDAVELPLWPIAPPPDSASMYPRN